MNARGKPLTPFETFKARLEQHLDELLPGETRDLHGSKVTVREYFSRRMDGAWADLFWAHCERIYDEELMRLDRAKKIPLVVVPVGLVSPTSRSPSPSTSCCLPEVDPVPSNGARSVALRVPSAEPPAELLLTNGAERTQPCSIVSHGGNCRILNWQSLPLSARSFGCTDCQRIVRA